MAKKTKYDKKEKVSSSDKNKRKNKLKNLGVPSNIADEIVSGETHGDHAKAMVEYCRTLKKAII